MPVRVLTPEIHRRGATRALVFGPPNSFKTTAAIATAHYPLHIVSCPGENGWGTIPSNIPGLTGYVWEQPPGDPVSASSVRKEVEDTVDQIIAGKKGPCRTLFIDGFHKLYDVYLDIATGGAYSKGNDFEPRLYTKAHRMADSFLTRVLASPVEYIMFSTWSEREADKVGSSNGHEWPAMPGKMAKLIVGHFSLVIFGRVVSVPAKDGKPAYLQGQWLLKPDLEVWGANVKMDPRLIHKLPPVVPQNWKKLYETVGQVEAEVADEDSPAATSGV